MKLTEHFTLEELTRSDYATRHGIDNTPPSDLLASAIMLAEGLERVRAVLSVPIYIKSGYRGPKINSAIGGASSSQHMKLQAADLVPIGMDLMASMQSIVDHEEFIGFDQLIYEGQWIHVSFSTEPRGDILRAHFNGNGVTYSKWV
jgi:zinc D-Ala-D-Ala carboxypeptidase